MARATLIFGSDAEQKLLRVKTLVGEEPTEYYGYPNEYITRKFSKGTRFIVFIDVPVSDLTVQNFLTKLASFEDAFIKNEDKKLETVPMPEIIVTAIEDINDPLPEVFNTDRWIRLTCNH